MHMLLLRLGSQLPIFYVCLSGNSVDAKKPVRGLSGGSSFEGVRVERAF